VKEADQPWIYYRDQIRKIGSLSDLSQRPVLLDMIVKTLPRLISSGEAINLPNLYKNYLLGEMKRQKVLKKREAGTRLTNCTLDKCRICEILSWI
jgi:hypothetical protein